MPPFVLTVLKVVFLLLLYFFVYRVVRAVATDLRGRSAVRAAGPAAPTPAKTSGRNRPPRSLVVMDERGSKQKTHRLDGNLQIGRSDGCQIVIDDTYASSNHARIFNRDGAWFIEDLGSTNGTYLNQRRLTAVAELRAGDRVKIGKTTLELRR